MKLIGSIYMKLILPAGKETDFASAIPSSEPGFEKFISILAPARGATQETLELNGGNFISILAPARGATRPETKTKTKTRDEISILAPARGATAMMHNCFSAICDTLLYIQHILCGNESIFRRIGWSGCFPARFRAPISGHFDVWRGSAQVLQEQRLARLNRCGPSHRFDLALI